MIKKQILRGALLASALMLVLAPASRADLVYPVTLNVGALSTDTNGAFSLDLQLLTGSGNVTNTITLSSFQFIGGTASGTPNFTSGGESGSFATTLTLTNSSGNNEFAEQFSSGVTQIKFNVDETLNSEVVGTGLPVPDQFNVYLDDNNAATNFVVATNDPSSNDAFLTSSIASTDRLDSAVSVFHSVAPDVTGVTAVPEPGSAALLLLGAVGLVARRKRAARVS
jgi:hypothetical protein